MGSLSPQSVMLPIPVLQRSWKPAWQSLRVLLPRKIFTFRRARTYLSKSTHWEPTSVQRELVLYDVARVRPGPIFTQGLLTDPKGQQRWIVSIHREGRRYAYNTAEDGISVVTEAHVTDPGIVTQLETGVAKLKALAVKENVHLPASTDQFVEIDHDRKPVAIGSLTTPGVGPFFGCTHWIQTPLDYLNLIPNVIYVSPMWSLARPLG